MSSKVHVFLWTLKEKILNGYKISTIWGLLLEDIQVADDGKPDLNCRMLGGGIASENHPDRWKTLPRFLDKSSSLDMYVVCMLSLSTIHLWLLLWLLISRCLSLSRLINPITSKLHSAHKALAALTPYTGYTLMWRKYRDIFVLDIQYTLRKFDAWQSAWFSTISLSEKCQKLTQLTWFVIFVVMFCMHIEYMSDLLRCYIIHNRKVVL